MKVAFINIDDSLGGASIACTRLAEAINNQDGIDVDLWVQKKTLNLPFIKSTNNGALSKAKAFIRFVIERLYFLFFERSKEVRFAFSPAFAGIDITREINFKEYDIIHIHWINFGFLSLKSLHTLTRLKVPIVWTMHDMWPFTGGCHYSNNCTNYESSCGNCSQFLRHPSNNDLSNSHLLKKTLSYDKNAKMHFVGCSKWISGLARKSTLLKPFKVSNIPNVVPSNFNPIDKKTSRGYLELSNSKLFILFVAMNITDKRKGFSYLKEALHKIAIDFDNANNIELLVIGNADGFQQESLPFKAHLFGKIIDLEKLNLVYNASDVFVIPSIQDNLPNTIIEALATGTPCVGFNVGGIPEMIDHLKNGYVSEYKSSESLSKGLQWILNHPGPKALTKNCLEKVKKEYSEKVVSNRYINIYKSF